MGKIVVVKTSTMEDSQTLVFSGGTTDEIADKVALFLGARGYALESGSKIQGIYGRGSKVGRALLGPLAKRLKFNVTVGKEGDDVALVVARGMSGAVGGLIGMSQEKKELQAIVIGIQSAILS